MSAHRGWPEGRAGPRPAPGNLVHANARLPVGASRLPEPHLGNDDPAGLREASKKLTQPPARECVSRSCAGSCVNAYPSSLSETI